jgi:CTP:molybdopterin cytidylyltransferase MocA
VAAVENARWREGRTSSIQEGLRALSPVSRGALLHQVDFPEVRAETVRALVASFAGLPRSEGQILVPVEGGRRGHPIVLGRSIWPEVAALSADEPLRTVVHRDPARVVEVAVPDPGIHRNRNVPSAEDR